MSEVSAWLRINRCAKGWSLREAAKRMGCSHVYLWDVERGSRRPGALWTLRASAAFGLSIPTVMAAWTSDRAAEDRREWAEAVEGWRDE